MYAKNACVRKVSANVFHLATAVDLAASVMAVDPAGKKRMNFSLFALKNCVA